MFATVGADASAWMTAIEKSIWNALDPVPQPPFDCSHEIIWSDEAALRFSALTSWFQTAPGGKRGSGSAWRPTVTIASNAAGRRIRTARLVGTNTRKSLARLRRRARPNNVKTIT